MSGSRALAGRPRVHCLLLYSVQVETPSDGVLTVASGKRHIPYSVTRGVQFACAATITLATSSLPRTDFGVDNLFSGDSRKTIRVFHVGISAPTYIFSHGWRRNYRLTDRNDITIWLQLLIPIALLLAA